VDGIDSRSVDDTMAAFAEDSRPIDHPQQPGVSTGKAEIRRGVSVTVRNSLSHSDPYSVSDVVIDGDTVSSSYLWLRDNGERYCAAGNEIDAIDGGLIVELGWGEDPGLCDD
jgi:hypothetical protein